MSVPDNTKTFCLDEGIAIIGRDSKNGVQLLYEEVSRSHAKLEVTAKTCALEDLGSSNGTLVNGRKISKQDLGDGDEIKIGNCVLTFKICADDKSHSDKFIPRQFSDKSSYMTVKTKKPAGFLKSFLNK